jgi:hypothetical protein
MARFEESLEHLGRTSGIEPEKHLRSAILSYDVVDPWVVNHAYSGMALWIHGKPSEAILQNDKAIALARQVNHPFTLALALCFAQWTHQFCGDAARVYALATEALELSHKYGFTFWTGWAEMMLAWADRGADRSSVRQRMKTALQLWQTTGSQLGLSYFQCLLAEQSEGAEAQFLLEAAEKFATEREEYFWMPDIHRLRGLHALREGYDDAPAKAEAKFLQALEWAEKLQAKGLALRAALEIARLQGSVVHSAMLKKHVEYFSTRDSFHDLEIARRIVQTAESG